MHGITIKNTSGQLLISSEAETLHLGGEAVFQSTILSYLSDFPTYTGDDGTKTLSGRFIHRYRSTLSDCPVFFIRPANYNYYHGIVQQFGSTGNWYVDIIQSGHTSAPPTVYAFVPPGSITAPAAGVGIKTQLANGRTAFDSRLLPLAIYDAKTVTPPQSPCDGGVPKVEGGYSWNDNALDFNFKCDTTYNSYPISTNNYTSNLMFTAPSVAQAVYTRQKNGYKNSSGYFSSQQHWSTAAWWAMYVNTYKIQNGELRAGWSVYAAGYWFSSTWEGVGWYDGGGSGGSVQNGDRPYTDKTINRTSNTVILAEATNYGGDTRGSGVTVVDISALSNRTFSDVGAIIPSEWFTLGPMVTIYFADDGNWLESGWTSGTYATGTWINNSPASTGNSYWFRAIFTGGTLNPYFTSAWTLIGEAWVAGAGTDMVFYQGQRLSSTFTFQIATDPNGNNIVAQATNVTFVAYAP